MIQIELDFNKANQYAENGMSVSVLNAESHIPGWSDDALLWLWEFVGLNRGREFMAEDVRKYAHDHGLPQPPSARSWGAVILSAARKGIIRAVGYGKVSNINAHCAFARKWVSA